jgi:hypothetical protein
MEDAPYIIGTPIAATLQNRISLLRAGIGSLIYDFLYTHFTYEEIKNYTQNVGSH